MEGKGKPGQRREKCEHKESAKRDGARKRVKERVKGWRQST